MAVQDDGTILKKADLKAYHEKILPYLGGNFMMSTNVSDYYSTDEKVVGVWTDGKPLYEKTLVGNLPTGSTGDNTVIWQNFTANGYEFHGGEGTLNWTSGRVAVPWSGGESNKACLNIYQGNLVIYWAASHFAGGTYIITVKYTKTADTASSALTTPGCYDISRPDLWPANQEIFFGNGLYGKRIVGTATKTQLAQGVPIASDISMSTARVYSKGGMIDMSGTSGTNWYDVAGSYSTFTCLACVYAGAVRFYCEPNNTFSSYQYNAWFTYTK